MTIKSQYSKTNNQIKSFTFKTPLNILEFTFCLLDCVHLLFGISDLEFVPKEHYVYNI